MTEYEEDQPRRGHMPSYRPDPNAGQSWWQRRLVRLIEKLTKLRPEANDCCLPLRSKTIALNGNATYPGIHFEIERIIQPDDET